MRAVSLILLLCLGGLLARAQVGVLIVADPIPGNLFCLAYQWTTITTGDIASYQWYYSANTINPNFVPIPGSSTPTLRVNQNGNYKVVVTAVDGGTAVSQTVGNLLGQPPKVPIDSQKKTICPGQTLPLTLQYANTTLQWLLNGQPIAGATQRTYPATQPGAYAVVLTDPAGCTVLSQPSMLSSVAAPTGQLSGSPLLCPQSTNALSVNGVEVNTTYQWLRDGVPLGSGRSNTFQASEAGTYQVLITDVNQCTALTPGLSLTSVPSLEIRLDSVAPRCYDQAAPIHLAGSPAGGVYAGAGVVGEWFDPQRVGVGAHLVTYTVGGPVACQRGVDRQLIVINPIPTVSLPPSVSLPPGSAIPIGQPAQAGEQYAWTPTGGLDWPNTARPRASPDSSITYTLRVSNSVGCTASGQTRVEVHPLTRLFIPGAFTPNHDGDNDVWTIRNAEVYPDIEVTIYNRWGLAVFFSRGYQQPFDGQDQPAGQYAYRIVYSFSSSPSVTLVGQLFLLR